MLRPKARRCGFSIGADVAGDANSIMGGLGSGRGVKQLPTCRRTRHDCEQSQGPRFFPPDSAGGRPRAGGCRSVVKKAKI